MPKPYRLRSKKASALILAQAMVSVRRQYELAKKFGPFSVEVAIAGGRVLALIDLMKTLGIPMKEFWNYTNQFKVEISPKTMGMPREDRSN